MRPGGISRPPCSLRWGYPDQVRGVPGRHPVLRRTRPPPTAIGLQHTPWLFVATALAPVLARVGWLFRTRRGACWTPLALLLLTCLVFAMDLRRRFELLTQEARIDREHGAGTG